MRYRARMIPMKSQTIFTSRWWALLWAAGILWAAHDFIGVAHVDSGAESNTVAANASDAASDDARIAALANTVNTLKAQ